MRRGRRRSWSRRWTSRHAPLSNLYNCHPQAANKISLYIAMHFDLAQAAAVLERTPKTLRAMLAGLGPEWLDATEGPDTWSPYIIMGHLIHAERTDWIPR